ncbi:MAG: DUF898 family protein [Clostridia bacterium]|nr:DUF898 family protein [Clostridia bacterium]
MAKKAKKVAYNPGESKFDGTILGFFGIFLFISLASLIPAIVMVVYVNVSGNDINISANEPTGLMFVLAMYAITFFVSLIGSFVLLKWDTNHTVISGQRLHFKGTFFGLLWTLIKWWFLTMITFGIYAFWIYIKLKQWQVKNTVSYPEVEEGKEKEEDEAPTVTYYTIDTVEEE